jgi:hypothetical protein
MTDTQARLDAIRADWNDSHFDSRIEQVAHADIGFLLAELERVTAALREAEDLVAALARDMERDPRTHDAGRVARIIEGILTRAALAGAARAAEEGE